MSKYSTLLGKSYRYHSDIDFSKLLIIKLIFCWQIHFYLSLCHISIYPARNPDNINKEKNSHPIIWKMTSVSQQLTCTFVEFLFFSYDPRGDNLIPTQNALCKCCELHAGSLFASNSFLHITLYNIYKLSEISRVDQTASFPVDVQTRGDNSEMW